MGAGELWRSMSAEYKAPYLQAEKRRQLYDAEFKKFLEQGGVKTARRKSKRLHAGKERKEGMKEGRKTIQR